MRYVPWLAIILLTLIIIGMALLGCDHRTIVKQVADDIVQSGEGECYWDAFDKICVIPQPVEVRVEVIRDNPDNIARIEALETELEAERNKPPRVEYIQLPGEKEIVEVRVEVPVPEIQIKEVVKIVTEQVEVPVEVIEIVYVDREVIKEVPGPERIVHVDREVIKEVEVEVIKEVEKIIKVPVETIKIVEVVKEVPVETIKEVEKIVTVGFTGKIELSDYWSGGGCAGTCHAVIKNGVHQWTQYTDEDGNVYKDND